jgi:hypothetical protein
MKGLIKSELSQVVLSLCVFSIPGLVYAARVDPLLPKRLRWLLPAFVILAPVGYWYLTRPEDHAPRTGDAHSLKEYKPAEKTPEPTTAKIELIAVNYEQLSNQAEYRDKLLINASYFSLAIIAVLANIFLNIDHEIRPLVAMVGAVTAYAFWLASESYKNSRDRINKGIRVIEDEQYPELNVVSTYDSRKRTPVGKRSLSSYLIGIQIVATMMWESVYLGYVLYLAFGLA